jgi:hypothetical protein
MLFEEWWKTMEAQGYQYGRDALQQVRMGYNAALANMSTNVVSADKALPELTDGIRN